VKDPWYGEYDGYVEVFDEIENACEAVIKNHS
jgi:protein-tyrosine-phosphatase